MCWRRFWTGGELTAVTDHATFRLRGAGPRATRWPITRGAGIWVEWARTPRLKRRS